MNLLIVGAGKGGSFDIRGEQLGAALSARVVHKPSKDDWRWASCVVLVKRYGALFAPEAHAAGVPIVWDALDCWSQPAENGFPEAQARQMLANTIAALRPMLTIGATQAMADACGGVYLPHHSWRGLVPMAPQASVRMVAYQGNPAYLGRWGAIALRECHARGWRLLVAPQGPELWQADLILALRDGPWDGWMCREWKSGVKVVNAIAAGRPVITQGTAAMRELQAPGSIVETDADLVAAFDAWTPLESRQQAYERCRELAPALRLPAVADRYRQILATVRDSCAA